MEDSDPLFNLSWTLNESNLWTLNDSLLNHSGPFLALDDFLPEELPGLLKTILAVLYSFVSAGALGGNVCVVVMIAANPSLRTVTNAFIMSLVCSDILVAAWNMPLQLVFNIRNEWILGNVMCKATSFIQGVTILSTILSLSAISLERYNAICNPIRARFMRSTRTACMIIIALWIVAVGVMLPHLWIQRLEQRLAWQPDTYPPIKIAYLCVEYFPRHFFNILYTYVFCVAFYIIPIAVMAFAYGKMARVLWVLKPVGDAMLSTHLLEKREQQKRNIVKMLVTILILFTVCWLPFFTMHVVLLYREMTYTLRVVQTFTLLIGYSNSFINPFIYFFLNAKFNRLCRKTLRRLQCWGKPARKISLTRRTTLQSSVM